MKKGVCSSFSHSPSLWSFVTALWSQQPRPAAVIKGEKHEERGMLVLLILSVSVELLHSPMVKRRRRLGRRDPA